jgi:hypothetical protein
MLVPDLHSDILVKKKNNTCLHIHTKAVPTWRHVSRVEENNIPHRNRRRKTLQPQKAAAPSSSLVENLKPPYPHKGKKEFTPQKT